MWASKSFSFSPSTIIKSSEVNQNFDDMVDGLNTAMPTGGIIMWSGAVVDIPAGWYLCNGSNGTPDLRGMFVIGAGGSYAVGASGGEATHTLTVAEMPSHNHGGATGGQSATHTHSYYYTQGLGNPIADGTKYTNTGSGTTGNASNDHTHAVSSQGSGTAHNNMPPYYALAFIMKS